MKEQIVQLEKTLEDERKKSEDLQFSIDEATYCGEDNSVINDIKKNILIQIFIIHLKYLISVTSSSI